MRQTAAFLFACVFFFSRAAFAGYDGDLFKAIARSDYNEVRRAVSSDVDLGRANEDGESPFEFALMHYKNPAVLKLLIKKDADYTEPLAKSKKSVLLTALKRYPDAELIGNLLAAKANVADVDEQKNGSLIYAYRYFQDPSIMAMLLDAGADIAQKDENGRNVLQLSVQDGKKRIAEVMLDYGADMNAAYPDGETPLQKAVLAGDEDITALLLDFGAELYPAKLGKKTLLMAAAETVRQPKIAHLLINAGIGVQERDAEGKTALMFAAEKNKNPQVMDVLLKAEAYPFTKDKNGKNAFDYLKMNPSDKNGDDYKKMTAMLNSKEYLPDFFELIKYGTLAEVTQAVEEGADVKEADASGILPIFLAARHAFDVRIFNYLVSRGASVSSLDKAGRGLLTYAAESQNTAVFDKLLEMKTDVNVADEQGDTVLIFLAQYAQNKTAVDMIEKLIRAGVNVNLQNVSGKTALMTAAEFSATPEVIDILLKAGAKTDLKSVVGKTAADYAKENFRLRAHEGYDAAIKTLEVKK